MHSTACALLKATKQRQPSALDTDTMSTLSCPSVSAMPPPPSKPTLTMLSAIIWTSSVSRIWTTSSCISRAPTRSMSSTSEKCFNASKNTNYTSSSRSVSFTFRRPTSSALSFPQKASKWILHVLQPLSIGPFPSQSTTSKSSLVSQTSIVASLKAIPVWFCQSPISSGNPRDSHGPPKLRKPSKGSKTPSPPLQSSNTSTQTSPSRCTQTPLVPQSLALSVSPTTVCYTP